MFGLWLALLASILLNIGDAFKKVLSERYSSAQVLFTFFLIGAIQNTLLLFYLESSHFPILNLMPLLFLNLIAALCSEVTFLMAIRSGQLSIVSPLAAAMPPLISLCLGMFFLGEHPSGMALIGVMLLIFGAYAIFLDKNKPNWLLTPFKSLFTDKVAFWIFLASLGFVLSGIFQRKIAAQSSPLFAFTLLLWLEVLVAGIYLFLTKSNLLLLFRKSPGASICGGLLWSGGISALFISMSYTLLAYSATISRVGVLLSILIGHFYFKEPQLKKRISAALIIIAGAAIIFWKV